MVDDVIQRMRRKIQKAIEQKERERHVTLLRKRIDLAKTGLNAAENGRIKDALRSFHGYLRILEDWKGVGRNGLTPALFEGKRDMHERLLISAVCWDLARIYDKSKSEARQKDFENYLQKFILFTKGAPFESLAAEILRRYIMGQRPIHVTEFRNAYKLLNNSQCFVATALMDVTSFETLPRLRDFRDDVLLKSSFGRCFVKSYYVCGPHAAAGVELLPRQARRCLGKFLDRFAQIVSTN
ncbi:MAG: CFI-box-CTERM domain-containing protein [Bdellovibrionota bacterium]